MGWRQVWSLFAKRVKPVQAPEVSAFYREMGALRKELRADHKRIENRIDDMIEEIREKQ